MGRFSRNQFGQEVYVPSVEERGGPSLGSVPFQPPSPSDRESQYEDFRFNEEQNEQRRRQEDYARREQERERERQLRESEEYQDWDSSMNEWLESVKEYRGRLSVLKQRATAKAEKEVRNNPAYAKYDEIDTANLGRFFARRAEEEFVREFGPEPQQRDAGIPERPRRPEATNTRRTVDPKIAKRQVEEQERILRESGEGRNKEIELRKGKRDRRDALLNSPEARKEASKVRQGTVSEEEFKAWWTSDKGYAWDVSVEGDAYQELWAQLNQEGATARMAGDLSGKTKERGGLGGAMGEDAYPVPDPETRAEVLAELEAEHNQREAGSQNPKPFDRNSYETFNLLKERMRSIAASEVVRHKEVRPIGTEAFPGQSGETAIKTIYSDPETEQQDALETYLKVNANGFSDEQASPENISTLAQTARSLANELVVRSEGISDASERQRVFQDTMDSYFAGKNLPPLTPEVMDELFGRGVMAVTGAQNDVRDSIASLKGVQRDFRLSSEILKTNVDTNNAVDRSSKAYRTLGVSWSKNVDHGEEVKKQLALGEKRTRLMDKIASVFQNPELPVSVRKKAKAAYEKLHSEYKQYDNDINYDSYVNTFASQTGMSVEEVRSKFSPEEVGQHSRTARMNASAVQAEWLDEIAGVIGKGAAISYLLAPFYGVDEASKKVGTLILTPFAAAAHAAVSFFNNATGIAAAFDPGLVGTASGMQKFLDTNQRAFEILEGEKFGKLAGEYVVGGIREAGTSVWQLMFAGSLGMGIKGISALYGLSQFGETYIRAQRMGLPDDMAFAHAHFSSLAESLPQLALPGLNRYAAVIAKGGWQRGMAGGIKKYRDFLFKTFLPIAGIELLQENITTFFQLLSTGLFMTDDPKKYLGDNLGKALLKTSLVTVYMSLMVAGGAGKRRKPSPDAESAFINATRQSVGETYVDLDAIADLVDESGYVDGVNLAEIHRLNPVAARELNRNGASRRMVKLLLGDKISQKLTTREARETFARNLIEYATKSGETARQEIREEQGATEPKSEQTVRDSQGNTHDIVVPAITPEGVQDFIDKNVQDNNGQPVEIVTPTESPTEAPVEGPTEAAPEVAPEDSTEEYVPEYEKDDWGNLFDQYGISESGMFHYKNQLIDDEDGEIIIARLRREAQDPVIAKIRNEEIERLQDMVRRAKQRRKEWIRNRQAPAEAPAVEAPVEPPIAEAPTEAAHEEDDDLTRDYDRISLRKKTNKELEEIAVKLKLRSFKGNNTKTLINKIIAAVNRRQPRDAKKLIESQSGIIKATLKEANGAVQSVVEYNRSYNRDAREIIKRMFITVAQFKELIGGGEVGGRKGEDEAALAVNFRFDEAADHNGNTEVMQWSDTGELFDNLVEWVHNKRPEYRMQGRDAVQEAEELIEMASEFVESQTPDSQLRYEGVESDLEEESDARDELDKNLGESEFELEQESESRVVPEKFEDDGSGTQERMFRGMDALPGQEDLFDADPVRDTEATPTEAAEGANLPAILKQSEELRQQAEDSTTDAQWEKLTDQAVELEDQYAKGLRDRVKAKVIDVIKSHPETKDTFSDERLNKLVEQDLTSHYFLSGNFPFMFDTLGPGAVGERTSDALTNKQKTVKALSEDLFRSWARAENLDEEGVFGPLSGWHKKKQAAMVQSFYELANDIHDAIGNEIQDIHTTPTEATPAEKQQQKADEAWKEAGRELTDFLGGGMAFAKKGESRREAFDRLTDKIATALVEQAKATGLKIGELAKKWYAEKSKGLSSEQKALTKKVASKAAKVASERLKAEQQKEQPKGESSDGGTTGTKNAKTDELREKMGLGERVRPEKQTQKELDAEAARIMQDDPTFAARLASELVASPRALEDPALEHVLGRYIRDLENRRQSGENVSDEMAMALKASEQAGKQEARTFRARQEVRAPDFSLPGILRQHTDTVGKEASKEDQAKYAELADQIKDLESKNEELQKKLVEEEIARRIAEAAASKKKKPAPKGTTRNKKGRARVVTDERADEAKERIRKRLQSTLTVGVDPEMLYDVTLVGVNLIENGVRDFSAWSAQVIGIAGDTIKPHLKKIWGDAQSQIKDALVKESIGTISKSNSRGIGALTKQLLRWAVESGIKGREAVVDAVHKELQKVVPEITRLETMQAISQYGVYRQLPGKDADVEIRQIKGQVRQLLKIEDLHNAIAQSHKWLKEGVSPTEVARRLRDNNLLPKATGFERATPDTIERGLIAEVDKLKKQLPVSVESREGQLKSALSTAKTAARNRLELLDKEVEAIEEAIAKRIPLEKPVEGATQLNPDEALAKLRKQLPERRKQRDALKAEYEKIFPPTKKQRTITAEQQTQRAINAIEKLKERLKAIKEGGETGRAKQPSLVPVDVQAQLKMWQGRLKEARRAAKEAELAQWEGEGGQVLPPKGRKILTDEQKLKMAEKMLDSQITKMESDLAAGRLGAEEASPSLTSAKKERLQKELAALKEVREQARKEDPAYQLKEEAKRHKRFRKAQERTLRFWENRADDAAAGKEPKPRKRSPVDNAILDNKLKIEKAKQRAIANIEKNRRANMNIGQWIGEGLHETTALLPRTLMAGLELSMFFRQGFFYVYAHPVLAFHNLVVKSIPAIFSERIALANTEDISARANAKEYIEGKVQLTQETGPETVLEEMYQSAIVRWLVTTEGKLWLPLRWHAIAYMMTERGFRNFSNGMKADKYDIIKNLTLRNREYFGSFTGATAKTWASEDTKLAGKSANIFSGRGTGLSGGSGFTSWFYFARRWAWSRIQAELILPFQLLTPKQVGQWNGDPAMRVAHAQLYIQTALGFAASMAAEYWMYVLLADDEDEMPSVEWDWRSSDLGKMKVGDTRIDRLGGMQQIAVLIGRMVTGETKTASGEIVPIYGEDIPFGYGDVGDAIVRYGVGKLGPAPSGLLDWFSGRNMVGEEKTTLDVVRDRMLPMTHVDIWEAEKSLGLKRGTLAALEAFFGASVMTYEKKKSKKGSSAADKLRKKMLPKIKSPSSIRADMLKPKKKSK